jgi:hypothetical protein
METIGGMIAKSLDQCMVLDVHRENPAPSTPTELAAGRAPSGTQVKNVSSPRDVSPSQ